MRLALSPTAYRIGFEGCLGSGSSEPKDPETLLLRKTKCLCVVQLRTLTVTLSR